jgi:indole-3-glycerol phosphate synthase
VTVLEDIVAGVREDLAEREATTPLAELKERAARMPEAVECVGRLHDDEAVAVIAEVKRSSPSKGSLASIDDPAALAGEYAAGGAAVIWSSPSSGGSTAVSRTWTRSGPRSTSPSCARTSW